MSRNTIWLMLAKQNKANNRIYIRALSECEHQEEECLIEPVTLNLLMGVITKCFTKAKAYYHAVSNESTGHSSRNVNS